MDPNRRRWLVLGALLPLGLVARRVRAGADDDVAQGGGDIVPLRKDKTEWKRLLEPKRYRVLFEDWTEPPNSSPLNREKRDGSFLCAACYLPLFDSGDKFESGTGWPSFTRHIPGRIATERDFSWIWPRTEYHCIRCGGHQGHVFDDGPPPTGQRWCNNGLALVFVPRGEALPELRT